ncbi:MAG TPA: DivIVA domain-containing protein [Gemmatimonadaceae bacterium]|nr:DivIVA domain-containing protein [Gemmatimonadaceae bacterium]
MIDEGFHLTALDVRRFDFGGRTFRGYDPAKVDDFRNQVAEELERLTRVIQELEGKAKNFHEQLRAFRERDKAINDALISAQQLRAEMREQAEREGQLILREAHAEGERIIEASRGDLEKMKAQLIQLEQSRVAFTHQLRMLVERQLAELAAAEGVVPRRVGDGEAGDARPDAKTPAWLESLVKE